MADEALHAPAEVPSTAAIPSTSFYGAHKAARSSLVQGIVARAKQRLQKSKLAQDPPHVAALRDERVWRVFPKQDMAFRSMDESPESLGCFAFESTTIAEGHRRYLVTSYGLLWE
eukprot:Opistho-1_new@1541